MSLKKDALYSARWALTRAIDENNYGSILDKASDYITQAKAYDLTEDVLPEEKERPNDPLGLKKYTLPIMKELPSDIRFDNQGNYRTGSGRAKGLVVHYTVSGDSPIGVARYMASKGLGCLTMGHDGVIWYPKNWDWNKQWDDHAGKSEWKGVTSLSRYCYGLEMCNWGKLNDVTKPKANHVRNVPKDKDNMKAGDYESFTYEQEVSLKNFILWQLDTNPDFDIEWVVGHDEIAPARKSDPGGSLTVTMPELREKIKELAQLETHS